MKPRGCRIANGVYLLRLKRLDSGFVVLVPLGAQRAAELGAFAFVVGAEDWAFGLVEEEVVLR